MFDAAGARKDRSRSSTLPQSGHSGFWTISRPTAVGMLHRCFNNRRLLEPIANIPQPEAEQCHYAMLDQPAVAA